MSDRKAADHFGLDRFYRQVLDVCLGGANAHGLDEPRNSAFISKDVGFDGTVRAVPDPARHSKRTRMVDGPLAEKDALHPAIDANLPGDLFFHRDQTTLISGASSAFIPTTL